MTGITQTFDRLARSARHLPPVADAEVDGARPSAPATDAPRGMLRWLHQSVGPAVLAQAPRTQLVAPYAMYTAFRASCAADPTAGVAGVVDYYNRHLAPALTTEECALQYWAQDLAYLHLQPGITLDLRIRDSLVPSDQAVRYADRYDVTRTLTDDGSAFNACLALPEDRDPQLAALLLLRGTNASPGMCTSGIAGLPRGWRDEFDLDGVARTGFRRNVGAARALLAETLRNQAHVVVVVGHSLGGAYGVRVMASLPDRAQARLRLVTFNAPGVNAAAAGAVTPGRDNVRMFRHHDDFVHRAGEAHPAGHVLTSRDGTVASAAPTIAHCLQPLVMAQLDGRPLRIEVADVAMARNPLLAELGRTLVGQVGKWTGLPL